MKSKGSHSPHVPKKGSTVMNDVRDYGNDPYFVKKADDMKALIQKVGLPKQLIERHGKSN